MCVREKEILVSVTGERWLLNKGQRASVMGVSGGKPCQSRVESKWKDPEVVLYRYALGKQGIG